MMEVGGRRRGEPLGRYRDATLGRWGGREGHEPWEGGGGEKQGNARVRFLSVCPLYPYYSRVFVCCIVPQYGRLAAIFKLLALYHSACLRNARRISYGSLIVGYLFIGTNKQTAKKTKSRRPTSLHLTCIIVGGGEKQGNARVRFLGICPVFVPYVFVCYVLFLSMVVWQPFELYWRLIIARVSEMHVAYHTLQFFLVYLHHWNKQHSTSESQRLCNIFPSFLPSLPASSSNGSVRVEEQGRGLGDVECD
jgi:hypothetical protein